MKSVLSEDMARNMPHFKLRTETLRSHTETLVHPIFRWIKEEVEVIDYLRFIDIQVTQGGKTWEIPLLSDTLEREPTNSQTEHSTH